MCCNGSGGGSAAGDLVAMYAPESTPTIVDLQPQSAVEASVSIGAVEIIVLILALIGAYAVSKKLGAA